MQNTIKITEDLYYIGCSDRKISLFENVYPVPNGISYNSYFLDDEKTVLFDTVDKSCSGQFFDNLNAVLNGRNLDYLIINHLEPDHSALIKDVVDRHPQVKIVCNAKTKQMLNQFFAFANDIEQNIELIQEGSILNTGKHEFTFVMAPMVHWPEAMVTFDITDKILFSADAFGSFGALNGNVFDNEVDFELKIDEYRRYYTNIVGKYGPQVNALLNKANALDVNMICPLHGLILKENIAKMIEYYSLWANYIPEEKSVLIAYASIYGGTQNAAEIIATKLAQKGLKNIKIYDVSQTHNSYIISDAFKYSHIVIASTTYNNGIFVNMAHFIDDLIKHNLQNRTFAIIENGSWACMCGNLIQNELEKLKGAKILDKKITIKSTTKEAQEFEINELVNLIIDDINS